MNELRRQALDMQQWLVEQGFTDVTLSAGVAAGCLTLSTGPHEKMPTFEYDLLVISKDGAVRWSRKGKPDVWVSGAKMRTQINMNYLLRHQGKV